MRLRPIRPRSVVAVVALATALTACGGAADDQLVDASPDTTTEASPQATPSPITETAAEPPVPDAGARCSAGNLMVAAVEPQGLTDAAVETWKAIREAAMSCDYERLAEIAPDEGFEFSFGGAEDPAPYWRQVENAGDPAMADLVQILGLAAAQDDEGNFVWPRVHLEPEDDAAWEEVEDIYTPTVVAEWREFGAYLGYRTAIAPDGTWLYFVAGD